MESKIAWKIDKLHLCIADIRLKTRKIPKEEKKIQNGKRDTIEWKTVFWASISEMQFDFLSLQTGNVCKYISIDNTSSIDIVISLKCGLEEAKKMKDKRENGGHLH